MRALPVVDTFERPGVCGPCGGKCCKGMPAAAFPIDFGATSEAMLQSLTEKLSTGRWAIDWWEGNPSDDSAGDGIEQAYFVRPAVRGNGQLFDPSWGGPCTFHSSTGCEIFSERPQGCRGLEPSDPPGKCTPRHSTKQDAAIAWLPFHSLILQAADAARVGSP